MEVPGVLRAIATPREQRHQPPAIAAAGGDVVLVIGDRLDLLFIMRAEEVDRLRRWRRIVGPRFLCALMLRPVFKRIHSVGIGQRSDHIEGRPRGRAAGTHRQAAVGVVLIGWVADAVDRPGHAAYRMRPDTVCTACIVGVGAEVVAGEGAGLGPDIADGIVGNGYRVRQARRTGGAGQVGARQAVEAVVGKW